MSIVYYLIAGYLFYFWIAFMVGFFVHGIPEIVVSKNPEANIPEGLKALSVLVLSALVKVFLFPIEFGIQVRLMLLGPWT